MSLLHPPYDEVRMLDMNIHFNNTNGSFSMRLLYQKLQLSTQTFVYSPVSKSIYFFYFNACISFIHSAIPTCISKLKSYSGE